MSSTKGSITFFGATGGCTANTLALALKAGYNCSALARTPAKLTDLLTKTHHVSQETIDAHLTITKGNIREIKDVKGAIAPNGQPASTIIYGIGSIPKLQWSLFTPVTLQDPTVCADGMSAILSALREFREEGTITESTRPRITAISTTGTDTKTRDIPYAYYGLYHVLLAVPHKDKRRMESFMARATTEPASQSPISSFTIVRPTLLMDGEPRGTEKVKAGWVPHPEAANKHEKGGKPAIGYTIRRADVGAWIFEECVEKGGSEWQNKCASLTY